MSRYSGEGECASCEAQFRFFLVDARENRRAFGYCDGCGATVLVDAAGGIVPGPIDDATAERLPACDCGGRFRGGAAPRCPHCRAALDAEASRGWIEARMRRHGAAFDWPGTWQDVHAIVIENRLVTDPDLA